LLELHSTVKRKFSSNARNKGLETAIDFGGADSEVGSIPGSIVGRESTARENREKYEKGQLV
jgi:hypothetical protein